MKLNIKRLFFMILLIGMMFYIGTSITYEACALSTSPTLDITDISIDTNITNSGFGNAMRTIIAILQVAGTGISIIVVSILGIKYMTASVEAKAEVKKEMVPVLIGMGLLFGAVNLIGIATNIIDAMF